MFTLKDLKQLIKFTDGIVDARSVQICIDSSKDGNESYVAASLSLVKIKSGETMLVARHE